MRRAELQMLLGGGAKAVEDDGARLAKRWQVLPVPMKAYGETLSSDTEREQFKGHSQRRCETPVQQRLNRVQPNLDL